MDYDLGAKLDQIIFLLNEINNNIKDVEENTEEEQEEQEELIHTINKQPRKQI